MFVSTTDEAATSLATARTICKEFGICARTLSRWLDDERLNFPRPLVINGRRYFRRGDIEAWKLARNGRIDDDIVEPQTMRLCSSSSWIAGNRRDSALARRMHISKVKDMLPSPMRPEHIRGK